jgi:hypothetical protein
MKKILAFAALVSITVACSDFFPRDKVEVGTGAGKSGPVAIPDKATIDPNACEYGHFESQDARAKFLWTVTSQTLCPRVREFRYYLTLLRLAADQMCVSNGGGNSEKDLAYLWNRTVSSYEFLVANPMGPLQADMRALAMEIYAWPDFNRFAAKNEVLKAHKLGAEYAMNLTPSRKGLASIEQLISNPKMIVEPGPAAELKPAEKEFNELPLPERRAARCTVLKAYLNDAAAHTELLYNAWSVGGGEYPRQVLARIQAGEAQTLLNELSDGLYYMEKVKDYKLGLPLGLGTRCVEPKCPDAVEFLRSGQGIVAMRANLDSFMIAMFGENGQPGFSDLLKGVNRHDLAQSLRTQIEAIDASLKEVENGPALDQQILSFDKALCVDETTSVPSCRLFFQVKNFMMFWKSDVLSALDLQQPKSEADGD